MKTNYGLRMAIVCLLGAASQSTLADTAWGTSKTFASEEGVVPTTQPVGISDLTGIPILTGRNILNTTFYYVKLTLTGGAVFDSDVDNLLKLACKYDGTNAGPSVVVQVPGKGLSEVTFQLSSGTLEADATCTLPGLVVKLLSGQKEYGLKAFVNYNTVEGSTTSTNTMSLVTFSQALSVKAEAIVGTTNNKVTVDVRSPALSKGFANGVVANYTATIPIGVVSYTNAGGVAGFTDAHADGSEYVSKFSIVVSGLPIAAASDSASGQIRTGGLFLATNGTCANYFSGGAAITTHDADHLKPVVSGSVTLDIEAVTNLNGANPYICMVADGVTTLPKGTAKFSIVTTPVPGKVPNTTVVSNELSSFVKNGASVKVLNISPSNHTSEYTYIRIYNMGETEASVYGTLYSPDAGKMLGTENALLGKVPKKGVLVVTTQKGTTNPLIDTLFSLATPWSGKAWMQIESDVQQVRVQALVRSLAAGGVAVDASGRVQADGECIQRSDEDICK